MRSVVELLILQSGRESKQFAMLQDPPKMDWRLVLLAVTVAVVSCGGACPSHCSCGYQQGLYVANCTLLPSVGGKIESLTLLPSHNPLQLLDGQFNSVRHIKYLSLRNCSIYLIHKKTFYGAKSLIEIDLSYNQIEEIEPTVFQHLSSLATLTLRGNPIQFISEVPFLISNSLQHLDIGECKIKHVPRGVFYGLKRLKYLSLDKNLLKSIKYNSLPKGLKYIDISNNLIVNVPTEVLSSLTNLRRLGLGGNPINCSCSLLNLQDWLSGRGVIFEDDVICALPPQYKGVSWSKVNENTLCLAEARREEMYHSIFNPLFKNKLYREKYFENENGYQGEHLQSDQPQPYTNLEAEVLFQNDDTLAMGEMMRDEDVTSGLNKDTEDDTIGDVPKLDELESKVGQLELKDKNTENQESNYDDTETEGENSEKGPLEAPGDDSEKIPEDVPESLVIKTEGLPEEAEGASEDGKPVEFKTLSEDDSNSEIDDLKNEGLLHAESVSFVMSNYTDTDEGSTAVPDFEETTEDEIPSTEETPLDTSETGEVVEDGSQNVTSSTETNNGTYLETSQGEVEETIPPPSIIPDLYTENIKNETNSSGIVAPRVEPEVTTNSGLQEEEEKSAITSDNGDEKIKQVAGAEVVLFCVGVLIVCLILYSVYRCRSKKRQTVRIVKEKPSNRDTEMQDMATLLPKVQVDEKKNNSKYPNKVPSSETEKLISNINEKEIPTVEPISETKDEIDSKNSINNNTSNVSNSPTSKTPLIQSEKPVTINPAAPIQRTRAKVGIIPDSIPRTPIFLQKTFNGTNNV